MNSIDYAVMLIYLLLMVGLGYWVGRKQHNTEDFLLAGRHMIWWPVAISLFASLFSAISYIAMPGEAFNFGMTMYLGGIVTLLPLPIMLMVFLRLFYKLKLWTAYEYFEGRFNVKVRIIGSCTFLLMRGVYLGTVLYATGLLLKAAIGWPMWLSILIIGVIGTLYTVLGGMTAVIWTDVAQFFILLGGIIIVIVVVAVKVPGGVIGIWDQANALGHGFNIGKNSGFWDFDFSQRITIWVWLVCFLPNCLSPAVDQVNLQRCLSCKSFKSAAMAICGSSIGMLPVTFLFYFSGLALLVYFKVIYKGPLPETLNGDTAFTFFAANILPAGLRGLLIAAILAAVMSTVDSTVNSLTAVSVKDIYERIMKPGQSEEHYLKVSKALTWWWGGISILFGFIIVGVFACRDIPLLEVSSISIGLLGGLMLGLFALGLMTCRANSFGAVSGLVFGLLFTCIITWIFYLAPAPEERISFMWIGLISPGSVIIFGYIASLFTKRETHDISHHVVWKAFRKNNETTS
jgi:SSS family transporter